MPDRLRDRRGLAVVRHSDGYGAVHPLTAAAQLVSVAETRRPQGIYESWQDEAWDFYENLGEFNYGVEWFAEALSRVRLTAAKITPGGDEPKIITEGPVAEFVSALAGGTDGQSSMLRSLGVQLAVAGDSYFVGRQVTLDDYANGYLLDATPDADNRVWTVQPVNTLRRSQRSIKTLLGRESRGWQLQVDEATWVALPGESLITRIWDRNERFPWRAMSPSKAALPIMREIDMYNRHIIATLVSRVALNGMMIIPDEITMPASIKYQDAVDPFIAELIDIMMQAIKNPGSPASAMPMPLRIPAEFVDKIKHFTFATPLDQKLFEHRDQALHRLATTLNLPAEIMTGMGQVNHWSAWQLTEDAIKIHISPKVEIITHGLTSGYLYPLMKAAGEDIRDADGGHYIIWYDTSELTQRPDRSEAARSLRDMMVISDAATRRENGFDEADAPTKDEVEDMVLKKLAVNPQTAAPALYELTGLKLDMSMAAPPAPVAGPNSSASGPVGGGNAGATTSVGAPRGSATGLNNQQNAGLRPSDRAASPPTPDTATTTASALTSSAAVVDIQQRTHSLRRRARQQTGNGR